MHRKERKPIPDPLRYLEKRDGAPYLERKTVAPWSRWISRHTTGEFARLGKGYKRHCGPTAITNVILSLHHRTPFLERPVSSRELFSKISAIGKRDLIYWNTDVFGHFGGTYDLFTWKYIWDCFRATGAHAHLSPAVFATKGRLQKAIAEGNLIYLQLTRNAIYGNHHLLCYGYTVLRNLHTGREETVLLLADGWSAEPRYLPLSELHLFHYFAITPAA